MSKIIFLLVTAAIFSSGCAQETKRLVLDPHAVLQSPSIIESPTIIGKTDAKIGITNGHIGIISGIGELHMTLGSNNEVTGEVMADGKGGYIYSHVKNDTATSEYYIKNCIWKAGAIFGITANGNALGVISGSGKLDLSIGQGRNFSCDVTADGKGGCIYSNAKNDTITSEYFIGSCIWKAGAIFGIIANGHALGVISGKGEFLLTLNNGKKVTGDVIADGKGGCVYSNIKNDTTTSEYYDGFRTWKPGAIIGITNKGKSIGVLSGTGKLDYFASGAHVIGDVTANGKGEFVYSFVINGTTTSEYWDGVSMWKAGAIIGVTDKGKNIGVLKGTRKKE